MAADYMKAIFKHAMKEIEEESLDASFLDGLEKRFVLTVPAVWSDKAKKMTLEVRVNRVFLFSFPVYFFVYFLFGLPFFLIYFLFWFTFLFGFPG